LCIVPANEAIFAMRIAPMPMKRAARRRIAFLFPPKVVSVADDN
jgi:hypothetical protein